jgi:hypothetical protein
MAMMLESYPMITDIEFLGEEHTHAAARIAVGSQGCTVALEKDQGSGRLFASRTCGLPKFVHWNAAKSPLPPNEPVEGHVLSAEVRLRGIDRSSTDSDRGATQVA